MSSERKNKWKITGTNRVVVFDDNNQTSQPKKKSVKTKRPLTGTRIHVTCYTNNEFIAECCTDGTLNNVHVVESADDTSRFQAVLVDHDRNNEYMSSVTVLIDWDQNEIECKKSLKNQYFAARDKVTALWKAHIQK